MSKLQISLLCGIVSYLLLELTSGLGIFILKKRNLFKKTYDKQVLKTQLSNLVNERDKYLVPDKTIGWRIRPNAVSRDGMRKANSQGLRADREYSQLPMEGIVRIAAFGDSFVHCDEVDNQSTWEVLLDEKLGKGFEVLNFGIPGQSPDLAYLRYQNEGKLYKPHLVVIGLMPENINRLINRSRTFYAHSPFTKPVFVVERGRLRLVENISRSMEDYERYLNDIDSAIKVMAKGDYFYRIIPKSGPFDFLPSVRFGKQLIHLYGRVLSSQAPYTRHFEYREGSPALGILLKVLESFSTEVRENGSNVMVLIFPTQRDIRKFQNTKRKRYQLVLDFLQKKSIGYLDLLDSLKRTDYQPSVNELFLAFHYSREGNDFVASEFVRYLSKETNLQLGKL